MTLPALAIPGQLLGPTSAYLPGAGVHTYNSHLYASIAGVPTTPHTAPSNSSKPSASTSKPHPPTTPLLPTLLIPRPTSALTNSNSKTNVLPKVDSTVLCRVTRTQTRQATVAILVVDDAVCADEFQGVIRREDVRATEKDRVVLGASFVPGDVVRAVVISLGDQSNYYLSTARNELGVVMAASEAGNAMYPVSWKEFRDPVTGEMEARKVAKPF